MSENDAMVKIIMLRERVLRLRASGHDTYELEEELESLKESLGTAS